MPTAKQRLRDNVIAAHGRTCMYCGAGPLQRRSLQIDTEVEVPMCHECYTRKGDTAFRDYMVMRVTQLKTEKDLLTSLWQMYQMAEARAEG